MKRAKESADWTHTPARAAAGIVLLLSAAILAMTTAPLQQAHANDEAAALPACTIDVNTASPAALELLPGVGPSLAERIVAFRSEHGPFDALKELDAVPGIGPRTLDDLAPFVRFSAPATQANR